MWAIISSDEKSATLALHTTAKTVNNRNAAFANILKVCPYPLEANGGVQSQVLALAEQFRKVGHRVTVLSPPLTADPARCMQFNGASVYTREALVGRRTVLRKLGDLGRYDIVHVHEPAHPYSISVVRSIRQRFKGRLVGTAHANNAGWYRPLARLAWFSVHKEFDALVASSRTAQLSAESYGMSVDAVVPLGLGAPPFQVQRSRTYQDAPSVLFIGRHDARKGLDDLLEAARGLPYVHFSIAGEGPLTRSLRAKYGAQTNIDWSGRISSQEKWTLLARSDIFCAPSRRSESFGMVLLEAMQAGVPVIASDIAGYREALGVPTIGELVPPRSPGALIRSVRTLLEDPSHYDRCSRIGRERANLFTIDASATKYLALYDLRFAEPDLNAAVGGFR